MREITQEDVAAARWLVRRRYPDSDFEGEALLGLVHAAREWDPLAPPRSTWPIRSRSGCATVAASWRSQLGNREVYWDGLDGRRYRATIGVMKAAPR